MEKELRAQGVHKPFVSVDGDVMHIESYPLNAIVKDGGCDPEQGPFQTVKLTDYSLTRPTSDSPLTTDSTITSVRVYLGSPLLRVVARLMVQYHADAHARSKAQELTA